jgi:hypothetical protein
VWCSLWDTGWILKYYLKELPLQKYFPCSPPDLNSSKLPPVVDAADLIRFQIIDKTIRNSKFRCLSEATPYYHNVFTFTLFILGGRSGVAWEPSNKMMLFLPPRKIKCLPLRPLISSLYLFFIYPSHLSLFVSKGLIIARRTGVRAMKITCWSCLWGEMSLNCSHHRLSCSSPDDIRVWSHVGMTLTSKVEELGENPASLRLLPQVPHGLTRARTGSSAVRDRRPTARAMARPRNEHTRGHES